MAGVLQLKTGEAEAGKANLLKAYEADPADAETLALDAAVQGGAAQARRARRPRPCRCAAPPPALSRRRVAGARAAAPVAQRPGAPRPVATPNPAAGASPCPGPSACRRFPRAPQPDAAAHQPRPRRAAPSSSTRSRTMIDDDARRSAAQAGGGAASTSRWRSWWPLVSAGRLLLVLGHTQEAQPRAQEAPGRGHRAAQARLLRLATRRRARRPTRRSRWTRTPPPPTATWPTPTPSAGASTAVATTRAARPRSTWRPPRRAARTAPTCTPPRRCIKTYGGKGKEALGDARGAREGLRRRRARPARCCTSRWASSR